MFVVVWGIQIFTAAAVRVIWTPIFYVGLLVLAGLLGAVVARFYSEPLNRRLRASFEEEKAALAGDRGIRNGTRRSCPCSLAVIGERSMRKCRRPGSDSPSLLTSTSGSPTPHFVLILILFILLLPRACNDP